MTSQVSPNTKAVLLLTAPLLLGRHTQAFDLLSATEYRRLCLRLLELNRQPSDLLTGDAESLMHSLEPELPRERMRSLLGRGLQLAQATERWAAMSVWVRSRSDEEYPRIWKQRLRDLAPPVVYGCGPVEVVDGTGIAVVGSRAANEAALSFASKVGELAARGGITVVSGSARGVDRAAMDAAGAAGGRVLGVLADGLETEVLRSTHREMLKNGRLVLVSAMDPKAGFNVGTTMQRNKLIYASASIGLVVCSDINKGGTWAGAIEQLERLRSVPVFVAQGLEPSKALDALRKKGALAWPDPSDPTALRALCSGSPPLVRQMEPVNELSLFSDSHANTDRVKPRSLAHTPQVEQPAPRAQPDPVLAPVVSGPSSTQASKEAERSHAVKLFERVAASILKLVAVPRTAQDVATELDVVLPQAEAWLERLRVQGMVRQSGAECRYTKVKPVRTAARKSVATQSRKKTEGAG